MTARIRALARRLRRGQDGAAAIEALAVMIAVFALILMIVQMFLVFMNVILVNHAIGIAAQEASARGGVDQAVTAKFISHLPDELQAQCAGTCLTSSQSSPGSLTEGGESTRRGDLIKLDYEYTQPLDLLGLIVPGASVTIHRTMQVTSQSLKQ